MRLLVVDDHPATRQLLTRSFAREGHAVSACARAKRALEVALAEHFDLLVLDVMLPDGSGLELCRTLREQAIYTPVLLLTARGDVRDRVEGLDAGADDYLPKPFAVAELLARARALARRGPTLRAEQIQAGAVTIDLHKRRVFAANRPVAMTAREFAILEVLAVRKGRVVSRDHIIEMIWGDVSDSANASLEVLIARIRRKLGGAKAPIQTHRGMGYAFVVDG